MYCTAGPTKFSKCVAMDWAPLRRSVKSKGLLRKIMVATKPITRTATAPRAISKLGKNDRRRSGITGDNRRFARQGSTAHFRRERINNLLPGAPSEGRSQAPRPAASAAAHSAGAGWQADQTALSEPDVRFDAHSGLKSDIAPCPLCANSGHHGLPASTQP